MYWAVNEFNADVGVQVTASYNPIEYNGMKLLNRDPGRLVEMSLQELKIWHKQVYSINAHNLVSFKKGHMNQK